MAKLVEIVKEWGFDKEGNPAEYVVQDDDGRVKFGSAGVTYPGEGGIWLRGRNVYNGAGIELAEDWNTKILTYKEWIEYPNKKEGIILNKQLESQYKFSPEDKVVVDKFLNMCKQLDHLGYTVTISDLAGIFIKNKQEKHTMIFHVDEFCSLYESIVKVEEAFTKGE